MALNDDAVLTAARGHIFTAPEGTDPPAPADISAFDPVAGFDGWNDIGHTSRGTLPEFGFDGGDTETRGTWQNQALKTVVTDPAVDYVTFVVHQFDDEGLGLYYGVANGSTTPGVFRVKSGSTKPVRRALLIVVVDGDTKIGFYAPKCDIRRDDAISLAVDEFGGMPLRATFLTYVHTTDGEITFDWISEDTGINPAPAG
ncbi:phage tail protein [Amycolatopsis cihanbeyliensis]|uniref:Major tail protein n=1 Tax=Amycolatopsis cihanbeyliensis TaxID=1128664 RepID=A0A542DNY9_AMYCI|nr:phage tail protein [Amycolatopsis cihanbeyliensis]TQJ04694.1 hypothetical protein FB471_4501 [Amycolatopsis cihanbeyliensis]